MGVIKSRISTRSRPIDMNERSDPDDKNKAKPLEKAKAEVPTHRHDEP